MIKLSKTFTFLTGLASVAGLVGLLSLSSLQQALAQATAQAPNALGNASAWADATQIIACQASGGCDLSGSKPLVLGTALQDWTYVLGKVGATASGTPTRYLGLDAGNNLVSGSPSGSGTVTSIATTAPISGGTITSTGTISLTGPSNLTTFTAGTVPMGAGTSAFVASEITDVGSAGVVIGSPTGGAKGAGTINMTGCFINNVACASGSSPSFSAITGGTNTSAAMVVGNGATLGATGSGAITATSMPTTGLSGTLQAAQEPAHTGDVTNSAGSLALTLATVNSNVGSFTNANITVNGKGLITAASNGSTGVNSGTALHGAYYATTGAAVSNDPYVIEEGGASPPRREYNLNATAPPALADGSNGGYQITLADAASGGLYVTAFGVFNAGYPLITSRHFGGTNASPTATPVGSTLLDIRGGGYDGTNVSNAATEYTCYAHNLWTTSDHSTDCSWWLTPAASTTEVRAMTLENDGGLMLPNGVTGGSQGAGTINVSGGFYVNGVSISGGSTPVVFSGAVTAGTSTAYTLASTTPSGFAFTNGYEVLTEFNTTNGASPTLSVNGTTATKIVFQSGAGLSNLVGGELQTNGQVYALQARTSCPAPISANCYVVTTVVPSGVTTTSTSPSAITASQWAVGGLYTITASGQTITLPASATAPLSPQGGLFVNAIGPVTVQSTSPDVICSAPGSCGSAGGTALILPGTFTSITSDGAGHIYVPLGTSSGLTIATTSTSGTGASPTAAQWQAGQGIVLNAASLTSTVPASSGLTPVGSVTIYAINSGTLTANAADTITYNNGSGSTTTSTGGSISLGAGTITVVTTDGSGHLYAAGNLPATGASVSASNNFTAQNFFASVIGAANTQSGTTYTLASSDCGKTVIFTSSSAVTVTIPASIVPSASTACIIGILQAGTAKVSVNGTAVTAATLISAHSYTGTSGTQGSEIGLTLSNVSSANDAFLTGDGS